VDKSAKMWITIWCHFPCLSNCLKTTPLVLKPNQPYMVASAHVNLKVVNNQVLSKSVSSFSGSMKSNYLAAIGLLCAVFAVSTALAQPKAEIVDLAGLQKVIQAPGDEVKVINFWATWCAPCIKELPLLEKLGQERKDVRVTLVSMDLDLDPNPEKVYKFVQRKKIQSKVLIVDAGSPSEWIDKVDPRWSGALPATLILNGKTGKSTFIERELQEGELEKLIAEVQ